jgi:hypothetical protein
MAITPLLVKDGNGIGRSLLTLLDPNGYYVPAHSLDANRPMYRASGVFTPQPTAAVVLLRIKGSATKTVRITRIAVEGVSTANANIPFALQRESTEGAGGTVVTPTVAKLDTSFADATAVVTHFTTSLVAAGTGVGGPLTSGYLTTNVVTTPTIAVPPRVLFPEEGCVGQSIVLRGAADYLVVKNTNAGNLSAGTVLGYTVEWIEDAS